MAHSQPDTKTQNAIEHERQEHLKTKIKLAAREREIHTIQRSGSYRLAKKIALGKLYVQVGLRTVKNLNPARIARNVKNKNYIHSTYASAEFTECFTKPKTTSTAVVVHLYYPEMATYFATALKRLGDKKYDLYVTIPNTKTDQRKSVLAALPNARIAVVPNGGRDVLPFIKVANELRHMGYDTVLKLHSKKSPHRSDGEEWRDRIVEHLLPKDKKVLKRLEMILATKNTSLVGPSSEYVSLLVNYAATTHHLQNILTKLYSKKLAREMQGIADEYGFFAGTMFWARLDSLQTILDLVQMDDFEPEMGQVDSTLAHALERLFCVVPELDGRELYGIKENTVDKMSYQTTNIPEWSELHIK